MSAFKWRQFADEVILWASVASRSTTRPSTAGSNATRPTRGTRRRDLEARRCPADPRRTAAQQTMEATLARLRAQREAAA